MQCMLLGYDIHITKVPCDNTSILRHHLLLGIIMPFLLLLSRSHHLTQIQPIPLEQIMTQDDLLLSRRVNPTKSPHRLSRRAKEANLVSLKYMGKIFLVNSSLFRMQNDLPEGSHAMISLRLRFDRTAWSLSGKVGLGLRLEEGALDEDTD